MHRRPERLRYCCHVSLILFLAGCHGTEPPQHPETGDAAGSTYTSSVSAQGATVQTRVSDQGPVRQVVISVVPRAGTRIPRRPGLTVKFRDGEDVVWLTPMPVRVSGPGDYFTDPPQAVLRYEGGGPVGLDLKYAYCVSEFRCYLVHVPVDISVLGNARQPGK